MSTEIAVREAMPPAPHEMVPPRDVMKYAQEAAREIVDIARSRNFIANVGGREYPMTECMTLIGNMTGHTVKIDWCRKVPSEWGIGDGWEARALVIDKRTGIEVAAAESMCLRSERSWAKRDEFAVRSMAQTRASGKALRLALGYIVTLAGWEALPAEEITDEMRGTSSARQAGPAAPAASGTLADERIRELVSLAGVDAAEVAKALTEGGVKGRDALADDVVYAQAKAIVVERWCSAAENGEPDDQVLVPDEVTDPPAGYGNEPS